MKTMIKFFFVVSGISMLATIGFINEMSDTNWAYVAISAFIGISFFLFAVITAIQHDEELDNE